MARGVARGGPCITREQTLRLGTFSGAWALVVLLSLSTPWSLAAAANPPGLSPGEYVAEGGWGRLRIKPAPSGALAFDIRATGANGHQCALDGQMRDGLAELPTLEPGQSCRLIFRPGVNGIEVASADASNCRHFCGARAGFEGLYRVTSASCTPSAIKRTRAEFKRHYDLKAFEAARAALEPMLAACAASLGWVETGWIRNDLAVTQYRLGDPGACRRVLEPLRADAQTSDREIRNKLPPSDADQWLSVLRAARTNLKLCAENAAR